MSRRTMWVALAALLVVDLVVVGMALQRVSAPVEVDVTTAPRPVESSASASETSVTAADAAPTTEAGSSPSPPAGVPLTRWIDAVSPTEAWRATAGSCPGEPGVIERSVDGGVTWVAVQSPAAVVRLNAQATDRAFVVGRAGEGCKLSFWSSQDAGGRWNEGRGNLSAAWYAEEGGVHSPAGSRAVPCAGPLVDLVALTDQQAAVLCADGSVYETRDAAQTWTLVGQQAGAVAVARSGETYLVAALGQEGCDGVRVMELATASAPRGCLGTPDAAKGQLAIAAVDVNVWIWVGGNVAVSQNGGGSWH